MKPIYYFTFALMILSAIFLIYCYNNNIDIHPIAVVLLAVANLSWCAAAIASDCLDEVRENEYH